jgi:hypothetical protein
MGLLNLRNKISIEKKFPANSTNMILISKFYTVLSDGVHCSRKGIGRSRMRRHGGDKDLGKRFC